MMRTYIYWPCMGFHVALGGTRRMVLQSMEWARRACWGPTSWLCHPCSNRTGPRSDSGGLGRPCSPTPSPRTSAASRARRRRGGISSASSSRTSTSAKAVTATGSPGWRSHPSFFACSDRFFLMSVPVGKSTLHVQIDLKENQTHENYEGMSASENILAEAENRNKNSARREALQALPELHSGLF